jgi:hypothetical protein
VGCCAKALRTELGIKCDAAALRSGGRPTSWSSTFYLTSDLRVGGNEEAARVSGTDAERCCQLKCLRLLSKMMAGGCVQERRCHS